MSTHSFVLHVLEDCKFTFADKSTSFLSMAGGKRLSSSPSKKKSSAEKPANPKPGTSTEIDSALGNSEESEESFLPPTIPERFYMYQLI